MLKSSNKSKFPVILSVFTALLFSAPVSAVVNCDLLLKTWATKRTVKRGSDGQLIFSKEAIEHFKESRNGLREIHAQLVSTQIGQPEVIQRLLLTVLMSKHAYVYGDPGSSKSAIARKVLTHLVEQPDGNWTEDYFPLQFSQQTSESKIRGFEDPKNPGTIITKGTLAESKYALADEIDKAQPGAIAAFNDILNERLVQLGDLTKPARTQSVVATSNMTVYELMALWQAQGMGPNASALLDRLHLKIYTNNFFTKNSDKARALELGQNRSANQAINFLEDPAQFSNQSSELTTRSSGKIKTDFVFLGKIGLALVPLMGQAETQGYEALRAVTADILEEMKLAYANRIKSSEEERMKALLEGKDIPAYVPPTEISNRNMMELSLQTVSASVWLDLLLLPENILNSDKLIKLASRGALPLTPSSAWRLQQSLLTAAPGDAKPVLVKGAGKKGARSGFDLEFDNAELDSILNFASNERTRYLIESIRAERNYFKSAYEKVMDSHKGLNTQIEDILSDLGDLGLGQQAKSAKSIEEFLYFVLYQQQ